MAQHAMVTGTPTIRPYLVLRVERDNIVASSIAALALYESYEYKKKMKVREHDNPRRGTAWPL
jgi:hypothetical protein